MLFDSWARGRGRCKGRMKTDSSGNTLFIACLTRAVQSIVRFCFERWILVTRTQGTWDTVAQNNCLDIQNPRPTFYPLVGHQASGVVDLVTQISNDLPDPEKDGSTPGDI